MEPKNYAESFIETIRDNEKIAGMIHKPVDMVARGIIIFLHGFNGERMDTHRVLVKAARHLVRKGLISLRFDFRGCGLSDGDFWHSTIRKRVEDVQEMMALASNLYPGLPITLIGFSDGCRIALSSLSLSSVSSLVLWSPILQLESGTDVTHSPWIRHPKDRTPVKSFLGHWVGFQYVKESQQSVIVSRKELPVLMITGGSDPDVIDSLNYLKGEFNCYNHEEIQGADHLYSSPVYEAALIDATCEWMVRISANQNH